MKIDKKELIKDGMFLDFLELFEWGMIAVIAILCIGVIFDMDIEPMTMQQLTYSSLILFAVVIADLIRDIRIGLMKEKEKMDSDSKKDIMQKHD